LAAEVAICSDVGVDGIVGRKVGETDPRLGNELGVDEIAMLDVCVTEGVHEMSESVINKNKI